MLDQIILEEEFKKLIETCDFEINTIIDAGANIGLSSIYLASKFPSAQIHSIEPEDSNYSILEKNLNYPRFNLHKAALWNEKKKMFLKDRGTGNWGFAVSSEAGSSESEEVINTITIDEILESNQLESIDILKIDIEGSEKDLFKSNYENWISRSKVILVEVHDYISPGASQQVFKTIANYDFELILMGEYLVFKNNNLLGLDR